MPQHLVKPKDRMAGYWKLNTRFPRTAATIATAEINRAVFGNKWLDNLKSTVRSFSADCSR